MRIFRVLAVVCLGAAVAFGQYVFPGGSVGIGVGASNVIATSAASVNTLPINITTLRLPDTSTLIVQCWSGTGGLTTAPFNPITVTSLSNPVSSSGLLTSITANWTTSTAFVTCRANSNGGSGPAGTNGATGAQGPVGPQGIQGPAGSFPSTQANTTPPATPSLGTTVYWSDSINKVLESKNDQGVVSHTVITAACESGSHISGVNDDGSFSCTPDTGGASPNAITGLTGDVSATGPGSVAATLATVNGSPGVCGDATHVCQTTTNGKGLVTAQSAIAISAPSNTTLTGDVTGSGSGSIATTLKTVNTVPGACGDSTHVCQVTTNGKGLVTAQSAVSISGTSAAAGGVTNDVQVKDVSGNLGGVHNATTQVKYLAQTGDGTNASPAGFGTIMAQHLGDMQAIRTSAKVITVGGNCTNLVPCWVGVGFHKFAIQASATVTLVSGSHTPTVYIWVDSGGAIQVAYGGIGVTNGDVSCSGCTATFSSAAGFPDASTAHTEIAQWTSSAAGSWDATGAQRASIYQSPFTIVGGPFMSVTPGATAFTVGMDTSLFTSSSAPKIAGAAATTADGCAQWASGILGSTGSACGSGGGGGATVLSTTAPQHTVGYDASNNYTTSTTSAGATTLAINGSAPSLVVAPQVDNTAAVQFENAAKNALALGIDSTNQGINIGGSPGSTGTSANVKVYATGSLNNGAAVQMQVNNSNAGSLAYSGFIASSGAISGTAGFLYGPILSTFGRVAGVTFAGTTTTDFGFATGANLSGSMNGPSVAINHVNGGMGLGGIVGIPAASVTHLLDIFGGVAATSGANHAGSCAAWNSFYWNSTASATDAWTICPSLGTGANPSSTLTISGSGSTGYHSIWFPTNVIIRHLTAEAGQHDLTGTVTITASTSGSQNFSVAYLNPPNCNITPTADPTPTGAYWVTTSTTAVTVNVAVSGTIAFNFICAGNPN